MGRVSDGVEDSTEVVIVAFLVALQLKQIESMENIVKIRIICFVFLVVP